MCQRFIETWSQFPSKYNSSTKSSLISWSMNITFSVYGKKVLLIKISKYVSVIFTQVLIHVNENYISTNSKTEFVQNVEYNSEDRS